MYSFEEENGYDFVMRIAQSVEDFANDAKFPRDNSVWRDIVRLREEIAERISNYEDMRNS